MFEDMAKGLKIIGELSPWFILVAILAAGWWFERKERIRVQADYKLRDDQTNQALNQISIFMELVKDRLSNLSND